MKPFVIKPARRANRHLNYILAAFCAVGFFAAANNTRASTTTLTFQPTPTDMNDLDHHLAYTWRLDNINLQNQAITSATLTFTNIRNWDDNANVLHLHLLDTSKNSGVQSFVDDPTGGVPVTDFTDDFVSTRYHSDPAWLVANGTADTLLDNPSFTTTPGTYTLTFNGSQLTALRNYLANGNNLAFGLDPDCHYFNDGITFTMNLTPVPEVASFAPVIGLIAVAASSEILRRRRRVPASI
jgi:hypothetical protein